MSDTSDTSSTSATSATSATSDAAAAPDPLHVAVLGTGLMGAPMARRLLGAGHKVRVWNRTREKAAPLGDEGATVADSPAAAVDGADVVVTMLLDGDAVAEVMRRAADGVTPGALWLQMSTVGLAADDLAELADGLGLRYVDAPVLGTKQPAELGELVVLAAADAGLRDEAAPVFSAVGSRTIPLDQPGQASRLKLVVNSWIVGMTALLGEAVALADALDVDAQDFLDAIDGSAVGAPYAGIKGSAMIDRAYPPSFPVSGVVKDLRLIRDAAGRAGLELRMATAAAERFSAAVDAGHGADDMAAVREAVTRG